jgi:hypothetical protein
MIETTEKPNLEGRKAQCGLGCGAEEDSNPELPFFEYLPDREFDRYYCGCMGWD